MDSAGTSFGFGANIMERSTSGQCFSNTATAEEAKSLWVDLGKDRTYEI
jgi:hypothetical protein